MPSADLVGGGLGCLWTGEGLTVTIERSHFLGIWVILLQIKNPATDIVAGFSMAICAKLWQGQ